MNFQIILVISSPSSSTTGFATLIFWAIITDFEVNNRDPLLVSGVANLQFMPVFGGMFPNRGESAGKNKCDRLFGFGLIISLTFRRIVNNGQQTFPIVSTQIRKH